MIKFKRGHLFLIQILWLCLQVPGMHFVWDVLHESCVHWLQFLIHCFKNCWRRHSFSPWEIPKTAECHYGKVRKEMYCCINSFKLYLHFSSFEKSKITKKLWVGNSPSCLALRKKFLANNQNLWNLGISGHGIFILNTGLMRRAQNL